MGKKPVLGRGIESLIKKNATSALLQNFDLDEKIGEKLAYTPAPPTPPQKQENNANAVIQIPLDKIKPNPYQPRKIFREQELKDLADSIAENGVLQPIVVQQQEDGFVIIAGERRYRASQLANLNYVPAIVKKVTDRDKLVFAIIENIQRAELNCVEEALGYFRLMEDFKLTQEEVSKKVGKDRSVIANHLRLLKLPRLAIEELQKGNLTFGHGKILASLKEIDVINKFAKKIVDESLSVRALEEAIKNLHAPSRPSNDSSTQENPYQHLSKDLQQKIGFKVEIKGKANGSGQMSIKFSSEEEFNQLYEHIMKAKH